MAAPKPKQLREITSIFKHLLEYIPKEHQLYAFIEEKINSYKDEQTIADN